MLAIYRASAGAGKTHKLTGEYLLLLFSQPAAYRKILAVTFTNKATDEMKGRIIEELYRLAAGMESGYVALLAGACGMDEAGVRGQARRTLTAILHDYAAFNISTIDRFFQSVMRAFTREIGLQGGYGIEMDQELVLTEAVDRLLANLENPENADLLGWLLRFAEDKIESGASWNLRGDMMSLGREVFKESYKNLSGALEKEIRDKKALENYKDSLFGIIRGTEQDVKEIALRAKGLLESHGLQAADFKGGSRSPLLLFEKWAKAEMKEPTNTFAGLADNPDACFAKSTPGHTRAKIEQVLADGLNDCIKEIIARFGNLSAYHTAKEIVRYYYTLGILGDIALRIAEYREEKNVMLIADTTELLNKVIAGSDAPFIYEKTGTQIDYFMIDEFQDTSAMQWNNFRPLLEESLAQDRANLIVGDVKQSIYRFRNSDWKLLDEQIARDFPPEQLREETLQENWRSCRHIVDFNNALFTVAPFLLQAMYNEGLDTSALGDGERSLYETRLMSAYRKSAQQVPAPFQNKEGHVRIEFLRQDEAGQTWREESLSRLPGILEQLQGNGYALKDIAILVRTNSEASAVAESLLAYKAAHPDGPCRYDIISDEALFVSRSAAVRFLLQILRHLKNPDDETCAKLALFSYRLLCGEWERQDFTDEEKRALPLLANQPLYEMAEGLYRLFQPYCAEQEEVFVQAFLDIVSEYAQKESADLSRFLKWWDESGYRRTVATPDGQNAIRILTVHKSKGLGFKCVIIPFGDWEIDHKPTKPLILWCRPAVAPFNRLSLVPVRYGQNLSKTLFAADYYKEKLHAYIDNLNTLYVAFTRAKEELVVLAPRPKKADAACASIGDLLWNSLRTDVRETAEGTPLCSLPEAFDEETGVFQLGDWWKPAARSESNPVSELPIRPLQSVSPDDRLHLRLHGKGFFFDDIRRKHGTLMHEILSGIRTVADIASAVDSYLSAGVIDHHEADELKQRLRRLLDTDEVRAWYDGSARILNEVDILVGKNAVKRPDRVMLYENRVVVMDYKFGEKEEKRYHTQVRTYLKLIRQMGYADVSGFLWYVELGKIIPAE